MATLSLEQVTKVFPTGAEAVRVLGLHVDEETVTETGNANGETLAARVELVEALGNESLVHFSTDARRVRNSGGAWTPDAAAQASGDIVGATAAEGVARVDPRVPVAPGDRIALAVEVGRLHFFDAETGNAIGASDRSEVTQPVGELPPERERLVST